MTEAASAFQRDQSKFLYLLREIEHQLGGQIGKEGIFFGISSLVQELNELELAGRLGFQGRPLDCVQRELPWGAEQHVIIWNDPLGGGGEIVTAHFMKMPLIHGTFRHRMDHPEVVAMLKEVVQKWTRAVQGTPEPKPYPGLAMPPPAGVDVHLFRDPMWRKLDMAIDQLSRPEALGDLHWDVGRGPRWILELNSLAKYEEVGEGALFAIDVERGGMQRGLILYHPAGGSTRLLVFQPAGRLSRASIDELRSRLIEWRDVRAFMLRLEGGGPGQPARRRAPRRRGPKVKHDLEADKRLYRDYLSSGIKNRSEFDRARGLEDGHTEKTYHRLKRAGLHKAIRSEVTGKGSRRKASSSPKKPSRAKERPS